MEINGPVENPTVVNTDIVANREGPVPVDGTTDELFVGFFGSVRSGRHCPACLECIYRHRISRGVFFAESPEFRVVGSPTVGKPDARIVGPVVIGVAEISTASAESARKELSGIRPVISVEDIDRRTVRAGEHHFKVAEERVLHIHAHVRDVRNGVDHLVGFKSFDGDGGFVIHVVAVRQKELLPVVAAPKYGTGIRFYTECIRVGNSARNGGDFADAQGVERGNVAENRTGGGEYVHSGAFDSSLHIRELYAHLVTERLVVHVSDLRHSKALVYGTVSHVVAEESSFVALFVTTRIRKRVIRAYGDGDAVGVTDFDCTLAIDRQTGESLQWGFRG